MNHQERINRICDIVLQYAENDPVKLEKWSNHVMAVRKAHGALNKELILLDLVGDLYDGLAYGNWPWSIRTNKFPEEGLKSEDSFE